MPWNITKKVGKEMKKLVFCLVIIACLLSSCTNKERGRSNLTLSKENNVSNDFFSKSKIESLKFKGRFSFIDEGVIERIVKLHVEEIAKMESGTVYELKVEPVDNVPKERLVLGYFYVEREKIYKILPTKEHKNSLKKKVLPEESTIVCQEKEIVDSLSKKQKGEHEYLSVNGEQREYHLYNDKVTTGYFESYIWKRNVGLLFYNSGYGAERDLVELKLLEE